MAHSFDPDPQRPGITAGKRAPRMAMKRPSLEMIAFAAAMLLPLLALCWRTFHGSIAGQAVLTLQWPEDRRTEATLQLNGVPQKVAVTGPLEYRCDPGEIRVVVAAQGSKPTRQTVFVEPGQKRAVRITLQSLEPSRQPTDTGPPGEAANSYTSPGGTAGGSPPGTAAAGVDGPREMEPSLVARTETPTAQAFAKPSAREVPRASADPPSPAQNESVVTFSPGFLDPNVSSRSTAGRAIPTPPTNGAGPEANAPTVLSVPSDKPLVAVNDSRPEEVAPAFRNASSPARSGSAQSKKAPVKPMAIIADPEMERLLAEGWGLIERGDHEPGTSRLLEARKQNRDDPRADFSLGLIDALINHDWSSAEKRFADCVRRDPENIPSLNNLAIANLHNRHEAEAVKHWQAIVDKHAVTVEVVQNLGRVRQLVKEGKLRKNTSLASST